MSDPTDSPEWAEAVAAIPDALVEACARARYGPRWDTLNDGGRMSLCIGIRRDLEPYWPAIQSHVLAETRREDIEVVKRVRVAEESRHLAEDRDRRTVPALVDAAHHCGEAIEVALRALLPDTEGEGNG